MPGSCTDRQRAPARPRPWGSSVSRPDPRWNHNFGGCVLSLESPSNRGHSASRQLYPWPIPPSGITREKHNEDASVCTRIASQCNALPKSAPTHRKELSYFGAFEIENRRGGFSAKVPREVNWLRLLYHASCIWNSENLLTD